MYFFDFVPHSCFFLSENTHPQTHTWNSLRSGLYHKVPEPSLIWLALSFDCRVFWNFLLCRSLDNSGIAGSYFEFALTQAHQLASENTFTLLQLPPATLDSWSWGVWPRAHDEIWQSTNFLKLCVARAGLRAPPWGTHPQLSSPSDTQRVFSVIPQWQLRTAAIRRVGPMVCRGSDTSRGQPQALCAAPLLWRKNSVLQRAQPPSGRS